MKFKNFLVQYSLDESVFKVFWEDEKHNKKGEKEISGKDESEVKQKMGKLYSHLKITKIEKLNNH